MLKFNLIISILIFFANAIACEGEIYNNKTKKICELKWNDKGKDRITEVIWYAKGCARREGEKKEDCYVIKTCETGHTSGPIFYEGGSLDRMCKLKNPDTRVLLGDKSEFPRSPAVATLQCVFLKAASFELTAPKVETVSCPIK